MTYTYYNTSQMLTASWGESEAELWTIIAIAHSYLLNCTQAKCLQCMKNSLSVFKEFRVGGSKGLSKSVLYKAEKPSVCLSALFDTLITQPCQHGLKQDLLEMKAVPLRITKFIFTSL